MSIQFPMTIINKFLNPPELDDEEIHRIERIIETNDEPDLCISTVLDVDRAAAEAFLEFKTQGIGKALSIPDSFRVFGRELTNQKSSPGPIKRTSRAKTQRKEIIPYKKADFWKERLNSLDFDRENPIPAMVEFLDYSVTNIQDYKFHKPQFQSKFQILFDKLTADDQTTLSNIQCALKLEQEKHLSTVKSGAERAQMELVLEQVELGVYRDILEHYQLFPNHTLERVMRNENILRYFNDFMEDQLELINKTSSK